MKKIFVIVFMFVTAFVVMFGMINIGNPVYGFHKSYSVEMLGDGDDRYEGHYYERKRRINNEKWVVDTYFNEEEGTVEQVYISEETGNSFTVKENSGLYGKLYCWLLVK